MVAIKTGIPKCLLCGGPPSFGSCFIPNAPLCKELNLPMGQAAGTHYLCAACTGRKDVYALVDSIYVKRLRAEAAAKREFN